MSPLDLSQVDVGQQRLEAVAKSKESPQDLKARLAQYRQTYISEVDTQKASLNASLANFQDIDAKAYVEKAAAALGTSVINLAAEGENLQAKGKPAETNAGEGGEEKIAKPEEVKLDMSKLLGLKDAVRTEMSAQQAELAIWQKMENIVARFNKERGEEGNGKAPNVTLENLSIFMTERQQKVNALTALKTQYQGILPTKSGSNKQALEETPKDMADAIAPFEQDIAMAKEAAKTQTEMAELDKSLGPIEASLTGKKTLTPAEYNQYLDQLNTFGQARIEALGVLSSSGSPFNGLADSINARIQQPFLAKVSRLHGMLEARKPDQSAEKDPQLEDKGVYSEHEFQLFKQKNALLLANVSKEAEALSKEHQDAQKKPDLWQNSEDFDAWSQRVAKCQKSLEELKTSATPWLEQPKLNLQAQDFLTTAIHPLEAKISNLQHIAAPERQKDVETRKKEIITARVQEMVTALETEWLEKEQSSVGLLRISDTLSGLDENSEEYKDSVKNQDALFSFVLSFESKIGFFLTKPDDLAPELVQKIKDLQFKGKDWRQIIIGDRTLRATLGAAADEKKVSHTVPAVEEWRTGHGPDGPEKQLVEISPERHEEYSIGDYIEFVNPLDPDNATLNEGRGWVWKKENLPAEVKQTLEQRADIIVSEQKQKAETDAAREAKKVGLENSLTERGKEVLLPQAAKYFEAVDLLAKGDTTAAIAAYTEYLYQSLQFSAEDQELHQSCIADARNKVQVNKDFPEYLEALRLQSHGLMEDAIKTFRILISKIKALPEDEQPKYQEQLSVSTEVIRQYNSDKLRMLSELSEDFIYLESVSRANMTLKGTANALDYLKLGTSPEDLEKASKMPESAREIMLPYLPAHLLTAQEKDRLSNKSGGLNGPEINAIREEIQALTEKVKKGDPPVNFEEEYAKIKEKLKPNTEREPGGVGWHDPNTGETLASGPSSRLMAFFDQVNSTDPAVREKGFLAIATEFKDQEVGMKFTQKYLRQAMLRRYRDFDTQDNGQLRETVKRRIATDRKTVAEVESNTRAAWEQWVKEENARPPKPGEEKSEIQLDPPDPLVYQSFRQKTFDSLLDYQYEREMRKVMTDRGDATKDGALDLYNWSMPHDADDAHWIKPWSWKNYSEDEWIDFKAQATEITIQTLATLPIGWGAGAIGRTTGLGAMRLLTGAAGRGLSGEALQLFAEGGLAALRNSPKVWKGLSYGMKAKLLAAKGAGYALGLAVEGTSLALMNSVWEGMYSGKSELFDSIDSGKYGKAGKYLLENIAKAGLFRMTGAAQTGVEGLAGATAGLPTKLMLKIAGESVSGSGGSGVEALFIMLHGQGEQVTWDWFASSMVQNAASSLAMHAGHKGVTIPQMGFVKGSKINTYRELKAGEQAMTRERLSDMGIRKPSDIVSARLDHSTGEMVLTIAGQDKPRRIPPAEMPFSHLPEDLQLSIYNRDKANRETTAQSLLQSGLDNPENWGRILEDGSVISLTGNTVKFPDIELLPQALKEKYQALRQRQGLEPYRAPAIIEPSAHATMKPVELPAVTPANDNANPSATPIPAPRPAPKLPPRSLQSGEAARRLEQPRRQLELFTRRDQFAQDPTTNAKALAEIEAQISAAAREKNLSPEQYHRQLLSEVEIYRGLEALDRSEGQLYGESKIIKKPVLDADGKQVTDAHGRPVYEEVNLFANYQSKSAAYSREMLRSLSYEQLMAEGGGKIIKLGGDELVVYHAGPDGTVQKLFIDISNMGPTNDTATNIAGSRVNLVDIYLHRLGEAVLAQSKGHQGRMLDPAAFNAEVQRVADSLFNLDRDANGIPLTVADAQKNFDRLKAEWGLEGNFQEYQTDMQSMRLLAEYRSDTRALDSSYKKHPERSFSEHITAEVEAISGLPIAQLQSLIAAHPQQFREAFEARQPKSPKLKAMPADQLMERIASLDPARSKPEEMMVLYALMARTDMGKLATIPAVKPLTDHLTASRQALVGDPPHPRVEEPRLMDAKVVTINLPPEIARALSSLADSDPVRAHAILATARQFSEKSLDALKYGRRGEFAEFKITDYVEVENGQLKIRENTADYSQAVESAQSDKKIGNVVDAEDSLRITRARMENLQQQLAEGKISHEEFLEKGKEIEREIATLQIRLSIDPDTGAYSQSYLDVQPTSMYLFPDGVLADSYRVWNSVVTELGNSGVINAKYGYQAMDSIMAEYCQILRQGIAAELPANLQHFKIIRSGGGKFEVAFLDGRAVEHLAKKGLTPHQLIERLARGPGQQAVDRMLQSDQQKAAASQSDAAVRNSQFIFNKGTEAISVGRLTSRTESIIENAAIQKAFDSNPEISSRRLIAIAREYSVLEPKPAHDSERVKNLSNAISNFRNLLSVNPKAGEDLSKAVKDFNDNASQSDRNKPFEIVRVLTQIGGPILAYDENGYLKIYENKSELPQQSQEKLLLLLNTPDEKVAPPAPAWPADFDRETEKRTNP